MFLARDPQFDYSTHIAQHRATQLQIQQGLLAAPPKPKDITNCTDKFTRLQLLARMAYYYLRPRYVSIT